MKGRVLRALLLALPLASPSAEVPEPVAIVGARVEIGDGRVLSKGTVLVQNGRIAAVGESVNVPSYARIIDGAGLTIYPGFIDAAANAPLTVPEIDPNQDDPPNPSETAPPSMREANRRGIRPEVDAALAYTPSPAGLLAERKAGFTNLCLVPTGGILNGRGAVVDLSARARRDVIVRSDVGMGAGFRRPAGTGYPGALLGITAQLRQALLDGEWASSLPPSARPSDPALSALATVRTTKMPLFFEADTENEIRRAQDIGNEFGLPITLVGALEGYKSSAELASAKIPAIVGVAFGPEPRLPGGAPEEVRRDREARFAERVGNLAALERAGVRFALTGRGTRDREAFWAGVRRAIAAGLTRSRAIQALTIDAARILGVDRELGTIEVGKRGNLIVTGQDFMAASSVVRYALIGGEVFRPDRDRLPTAATPREPDDDDNHDADDLCEPQVKRGGGR